MLDFHLLLDFARGGGGGSGGGGGGGSGGGGLFSLLAALGYIPVNYSVTRSTRKWNRTAGVLTGIPVCFVISILALIILRGYGFIVAIGAISGLFAGSFGLHAKIKKMSHKSKKHMTLAASKDPAWEESGLKTVVEKTFLSYQNDWSTFNLANMQQYLTQSYFDHMRLVLTAMHTMGRRNAVNNPKILLIEFINAQDSENNSQDTFTVAIEAQADDILIDTLDNNKQIHQDKNSFVEYWTFIRDGSNWKLHEIKQATESKDPKSESLRNFASKNSFYYNADFGWLLLPNRGQLFSGARFKISDVNNHIIGVYRSVLVQFYSYTENTEAPKYKVIAQAVLPKSYGNIVVRRKKRFFQLNIRGLNKLSMEGSEFNGKYQVFASDVEQVTSFELLHPAFMVQLIDLPYEVNIEVVDNILYLYSTDSKTSYDSMMELLKKAFDELKL